MTSIFRCLKAEFLKCKHSVLLYIHILIPLLGAIIFAGYFLVSGWDVQTKVSAYLEVLAVSFPFLAGIIVGIVVQIEHQAGHYQLMLGTIPSRPATYIGKILLLIIGAIGAVVLALGVFALIYQEAPFALYLKAGTLLILTSLPLYLIHLFVGLNFGKGASMGLGIAGSFETELASKIATLSSLLYTDAEKLKAGLGDVVKTSAQAEADYYHDVILKDMGALREAGDELEKLMGGKYLPYPTYSDLLFGVN